ncbi:ribosome hibernation-promoting factor, HPF/YfiA family [Leptothoe kymatousa]|uniref:Ribosome hibernation promoting factor n=1 Tax=Leptothoe kymatousa TAU-MAC 1615 TaxID=2364775 RepID=A0ABS5Y0I7_9CYAN|nr:ribosome-associated translation inhibitor RaiA [Leptothoe kymatousa]MBT9311349.1 ribosome-associated translation inhibitor RaiA [Leptothoe kymatousa TAU-MAC 1615]
MKLVIQGKNIEITEAIRQHVSQKIEKSVSHFQRMINKVDVCLSVAGGVKMPTRQYAEVTVHVNRAVVRAEESSDSLYASIDLVADKISRQLRKYKEKRRSTDHVSVRSMDVDISSDGADLQVSELLAQGKPQLPAEVVRTKYFAMVPMTAQEALENLQLIDHDFYVFHNIETNQINVMYDRNHGGYGLIQPRPAAVNNDHHGNGHHSNGHHSNGHHGNGHRASSHNGHSSAGDLHLQAAPVRK